MAGGLLRIPYQTEGFPPGATTNGSFELHTTWDEVLWAAVTVGRPSWHYVFQHGIASWFEALFRWSLIRMALEQQSPGAYRLRRTNAVKNLDPTEKGMVNYFLGMTFCKLFAAKCLDTPWVLHLDVFRPAITPQLSGRQRPDLVGEELSTGAWHAFESKGRAGPPDATTKAKAKNQALRVISVGGTTCTLHVGAITYFRGDALHFYWRDPSPKDNATINVDFTPDAWRFYYAPTLDLLRATERLPPVESRGLRLVPLDELDLQFGVHPLVREHLDRQDWDAARLVASKQRDQLTERGFQSDGIAIRAGDSWQKRFRNLGRIEG